MNAQTENPLAKFDAAALKGIESSSGDLGAPRALFLPSGFGEAMELAKLMAAGFAVPPHLRGKPADCLAVLMQSARWGLDPFAVASKSYFVNDRMAYEAQLVVAVLNTSGVLKGRMHFDYEQTDTDLICRATATLKADPRDKSVEQEFSKVKVKNSPLWQSSPRQQLGYYTARMWARLYAPEVLLGVYTVEEIAEMGLENARDVTPAPTRKSIAARKTRAAEPEPEAEVVINGEAEVVEQSEEEIARTLDAEQTAAQEGRGDEDMGEAHNGAEPEPEADDGKDWGPTLSQIDAELDARETVIDVESYWKITVPVLRHAPESVQNRANGLKNARVRELGGA
ncbi:recombinase RecT [Sphingobium phenoxybenzoativorans]|uniref:Recombinase RecT n=1 Tax=Sphingobium phenoxybenzoativorans TaxID=1592790 RepID=A0A975Q077_9SPHN|nr:recombinase RecT [Sphingobium phenoxybenzoativorans]QUT04017.1 recombinase RecT [Sphingobium phenoxybenzoativorans]